MTSRDHEMNLSKGKDPAPEQINIDELQKILQNIDPNGDMNQVQGSGSIFIQSEFVFLCTFWLVAWFLPINNDFS